MKRKTSWEAIRRGNAYCAPACGRGCTWREYQTAIRDGNKLLRMMKGDGWKLHIRENLGWYYNVHNDHLNVHPTTGGRFYCLLSSEKNGAGGDSLWHVENSYSKDPNKAVMIQFASAREVVAKLQTAVLTVKKIINL